MHKKFEINWTKFKGGCQPERKVVSHNSKSDLPLYKARQKIVVSNSVDSANDMNTNAYKSAIHKVHERTIYEPSNALPFYVRDCGGGWACFESRHKDWRFYYLSVNTRLTEPEVVMEWSLNPMVF